ncbi:MAG TPA: hypothetical protein VJG30_02045 [Candidatus Nanoarchaeia archaeon]|nr:hypothetical protein [Candidatus Nanoarchaeia archaeon]
MSFELVTLLEEHLSRDARELASYSITRSSHAIKSSLPGVPISYKKGFDSSKFRARVLDKYYILIEEHYILFREICSPFGIYDYKDDYKELAENRLYERALKCAETTAHDDRNKLVNLTSRVQKNEGSIVRLPVFGERQK